MSDKKTLTPDAMPDQYDYAALSSEFTTEEQNAAAWLALVLLLAENRAMCDALRKLIVQKGLATDEEVLECIKTELEQPNLGRWYGFMNQLYAFRVAETLDIQKRKKEGDLDEDTPGPKGDITEASGGPPIPTGAPPKEDIVAATQIVQAEPNVEADTDGEEK